MVKVYIEVTDGEVIGYSHIKYPPYDIEVDYDFDFENYSYTYNNGVITSVDKPGRFPDETQAERSARFEVRRCERWFRWYDCQVSQAMRAERTGAEWSAIDSDGKKYATLADLDTEANAKQAVIKLLRPKMAEAILNQDNTSLGLYATSR
jgi:hypothetical protein